MLFRSTRMNQEERLVATFRAMVVPVGKCRTLLTVPPLPDPSSFTISRSSWRMSRLNSIPISSWASFPTSSALEPPAPQLEPLPEPEEADGLGGPRARPLTFLRFMERGAKLVSDMAGDVENAQVGRLSEGGTRGRSRGEYNNGTLADRCYMAQMSRDRHSCISRSAVGCRSRGAWPDLDLTF